MKKILMIDTVQFNKNGITTVITSLIDNLKQSDFSISLLVNGNIDQIMKEYLENKNVSLYEFPDRKENLYYYLKLLYKLLSKGKFDIIHIHGNSGTMIFEAMIGKLLHVRKIVIHCHNNHTNYPILNKILKKFLKFFYTDAIACSKLAGDWLFGKQNYHILKNGIDTQKFMFSYDNYLKIRKELQISNELVLGHVGLFNYQKNQEFLLNILNELNKRNIPAKLLLIGDGELKAAIKNKIKEMKLTKHVIILNNRDDIYSLLSCMDIFVFPSRWEGFGIALLEAQANGLPCIVSTNVSKEVNVTDTLKYCDLSNLSQWINEICNINISQRKINSQNNIKKIQKENYDIKNSINFIEKIYCD